MSKVPVVKVCWAEVRVATATRRLLLELRGEPALAHTQVEAAGDSRTGHALDILKVVATWSVAGLDDCIGQNAPEMTL